MKCPWTFLLQIIYFQCCIQKRLYPSGFVTVYFIPFDINLYVEKACNYVQPSVLKFMLPIAAHDVDVRIILYKKLNLINLYRRMAAAGQTQLFVATQNGNLAEVNRLLAAGANKDAENVNKQTPLFVAAFNGHTAIVERLLAAGANIEAENVNKATPLYIAAWKGHTAIVERLLAAGANKEAQDVNKATPLFVAAFNGHTAIVERLLAAGANIEAENVYKITPLFIAAWKGHTAIVERLLAAGANKDAENVNKQTPLFVAAWKGHTAIVERLLAAGANIEAQDVNKATPLFVAASNGHTAIVERLLAAGANIEAENVNKITPLFVAAWKGHIVILERLLAAGANKEAQCVNKQTPLFIAASYGHTAIVERLLAAGANIETKNKNGKTALDIAREKGHAEIVRLIEDKMPKTIWRGFSRSDISMLNSIFETEPAPGQTRSDAENVSCCPVCFKIVPVGRAAPQTVSRATGCMYMLDHNCSTLGGYYHKRLYDKYKNERGEITWCTICGRICQRTPHRHYQLELASKPKAATIEAFDHTANPFGGEADCIKYGGGGLKEKLMRYRRMREYALDLQDEIGKIKFDEAIDQLIEETWNAPLMRSRKLETIAREKKWNIPNTEFKEFRNNNAAMSPTANVPYPFAGKPAMAPILDGEGMNNISMADTPVLIQLVHRREDGSVRPHEQKISIHTLFEALDKQFGGAGSPNFGKCLFDDGCNGIHYPDELQYILNHYPEAHLPATDRDRYQGMIDAYRKRFNEAYRDVAAFKARVDANIAAAANMPVGGAGHAGGRRRTIRRGRKKDRRTRKY